MSMVVEEDYDQDLREATHDDAVRVLKNTGGQVTFLTIVITMMLVMIVIT